MGKDERNIYDLVMIVQDITCWSTIWSGKDLATAKAVRKAYCDGYYDRKMEELKNE